MILRLRPLAWVVIFSAVSMTANAAPKTHVVALGKWTTIAMRSEQGDSDPINLRIRPLYVDGRVKEFTTGNAHDVTEHTFVVQKISRVNDSLPQESGPPQWRWERGGWVLVDRVNGKIQQIALADFDPDTSSVDWFRDYAAYCGYSEDDQKLLAVIMQLGERRPVLKKIIGPTKDFPEPCSPPLWERDPVRVTFSVSPDQKLTFALKSRAGAASAETEPEKADEENAGD